VRVACRSPDQGDMKTTCRIYAVDWSICTIRRPSQRFSTTRAACSVLLQTNTNVLLVQHSIPGHASVYRLITSVRPLTRCRNAPCSLRTSRQHTPHAERAQATAYMALRITPCGRGRTGKTG
jgi:hypothetical protein